MVTKNSILLSLVLVSTLAVLSQAVSVKNLQVWTATDKQVQLMAGSIDYNSGADVPMILGGQTNSDDAFITYGKWTSADGFSNTTTKAFKFADYDDCVNTKVGYLSATAYEKNFFATMICNKGSAKYDIVLVRFNEKGEVNKWAKVAFPDAQTDEDKFSLVVEYMENNILIAYSDKDDNDFIVAVNGDFVLKFSAEALKVTVSSLGSKVDSDEFYVVGTYTGDSKPYPYISRFNAAGQAQKEQYFKIENTVGTAIATAGTKVQLCLGTVDSQGKVLNHSSIFMDKDSVLAYRVIEFNQDGAISCAASSDGKSFYRSVGNKTTNLATWTFDDVYNYAATFKLTENPNDFQVASTQMITDAKGEYLYYSFMGTKDSKSYAGFAALDVDATGNGFSSLVSDTKTTEPNKPAATDVPDSVDAWKVNAIAGYTLTASTASDVVTATDVTFTTLSIPEPKKDTTGASVVVTSVFAFICLAFAF
mmetsp:Transcript_34655/g.39266  ORF Transcript_34655/g.39266 Transcript_34655/m.39266 type:complete len:477 (-) Transcript_34655:133-1563(-)